MVTGVLLVVPCRSIFKRCFVVCFLLLQTMLLTFQLSPLLQGGFLQQHAQEELKHLAKPIPTELGSHRRLPYATHMEVGIPPWFVQ